MEEMILGISLLLFLASMGTALYVRKSLVQYTGEICDCLDAMLAGRTDIDFHEDQETLIGKIQVKMRQLYEILEKRTEESLRQREQLESMISDISHQVKTPITSIRMYHNLLERKELSQEKREEFLRAVENQVDKLEFFMNSMIKMSRLETGIVKVQPSESRVHELIARAVCDVALKAEKKEIAIEVDCKEELTAYFDSRWTAEALFNILDNGVKYTGPGGRIEIFAEKTDFFVRIKVKDNGKGIARARIPDIFKRFYREPESAQIEGVGIGLYLAREIVMKQKGFIEVRSREGEGTEVYINLPTERQ